MSQVVAVVVVQDVNLSVRDASLLYVQKVHDQDKIKEYAFVVAFHNVDQLKLTHQVNIVTSQVSARVALIIAVFAVIVSQVAPVDNKYHGHQFDTQVRYMIDDHRVSVLVFV